MPTSISFGQAAEYYDETRGFPPGEEAHIADLLYTAGKLTPDSCVLEVGVGTGRIALPLATHGSRITGLDLARAMLARLVTKRIAEPIDLVQGDTTRLPFSDGAFDVAVAVHVFHLISAWKQALKEVARVLRPAGILLHGWRSIDRRDDRGDVLWHAWDAAVGPLSTRNVGVLRKEYDTFLVEQGWHPVGERVTHTFKMTRTPRIFLERLERRVWSSIWRLSDAAVAQGLVAVRDAIQQHHMLLDERVEFDAHFHVQVYAPRSSQIRTP